MKPIVPLLLPIAVASCPTLHGAIIYSDDFSGTGNLNGSAPDVRPVAETWLSRTTATAVTTNGSTANATSGSTSSLPFTAASGNIYRIAADVTYSASTTGASVFGGIGFFDADVAGAGGTDNSYNNFTESTPWVFIRAGYTGTPAEDIRIGDISVRPNQSVGITNNDTNLTVTSPITLSLILDTTVSTAWTLRAFYGATELDANGATAGLMLTYNSTQSAALATAITHVGLSNSNTSSITARWDNFVLETIPEPSSALLAAGGLGLALSRRRRSA